MTITNYDKSSHGINIELDIFWDGDAARHDFDDFFYRDATGEHLCYRDHVGLDNNYLDLSDLGNYEFDMFDLHKALAEYASNYEEDMDELSKFDRKMLKAYMEEELGDVVVEAAQGFFKPTYLTMGFSGYSQGDYREVIIPKRELDEMGGTDEEKRESLQDIIHHLLFDSPLYCCIRIDKKEFFISDDLSDVYEYDKDAIVTAIAGHVALGYNEAERGYILNWINDNLPDHPDYHD